MIIKPSAHRIHIVNASSKANLFVAELHTYSGIEVSYKYDNTPDEAFMTLFFSVNHSEVTEPEMRFIYGSYMRYIHVDVQIPNGSTLTDQIVSEVCAAVVEQIVRCIRAIN